jgi:hypothetical protein
VAVLKVVLERLPPPLTVHFMPALLTSLVTVAVRVTASVASTVDADAVTLTLGVGGGGVDDEEPPPQPERRIAVAIKTQGMTEIFENMITPQD